MSKLIRYIRFYIRYVLLKLKYGKRLQIELFNNKRPTYIGKVKIGISSGGGIRIKGGTCISDYCQLIVVDNGYIEIGKESYIGMYSRIFSRTGVTVGENVLMADNTSIYDHNHIYNIEGSIRDSGYKSAPVFIGNNCWLATNVVVTMGSKIGDRAVIGANVVVRGTFANNTVYAVSAKAVKRF